MQVRLATPDDAEPLLRVLCDAFGLDHDAARPLFYRDPYFDLALKRVLAVPEHGVVACLTIIPSTLVVRGIALQTGGIAGVATTPRHQGHGYASHLLAETVRALGREHTPLSALFPYSEEFYRRLGWETAARARRWTGTLAPGSCEAEAGHIRPASLQDPQDRILLEHLRNALPPQEAGLCRRGPQRWRVLEMTTQAWEWHIFETHGRCEGYVAWQHPDSPDAPVVLHEMAAATPEARRGLAAFLVRALGEHTSLAWAASAGQPAAYGFPTGVARTAVEPGMMLRVVDLAAVLQALHPVLAPALAHGPHGLTVWATDPVRPENNAPLRLTPHGIEPGSAHDPDWLRAPIGTLAPLVTGDCLPSDLAVQGKIEASSPAVLALADMLFPLTHPFVAPADQF